jgi:hypothetical protein
MNVLKEYYEILSTFKTIIDQKEFNVSDKNFSKEYVKSLILSNPNFSLPLNILKEKYKFQFEQNKNIFQLIKNLNKKQQKENRTILLNMPNFEIFYNEPHYIKILNEKIYENYTTLLNDLAREFKLISIVNG